MSACVSLVRSVALTHPNVEPRTNTRAAEGLFDTLRCQRVSVLLLEILDSINITLGQGVREIPQGRTISAPIDILDQPGCIVVCARVRIAHGR